MKFEMFYYTENTTDKNTVLVEAHITASRSKKMARNGRDLQLQMVEAPLFWGEGRKQFKIKKKKSRFYMGTSVFETTGKYQHLQKYQMEVSGCF